MTQPLVSVIIAAYNGARYLPETLESVLSQTYPQVETLLVDDGSTDDTAEQIAPFLGRIRYVRIPHQGLAAARNEGVRLAGGHFIAPLDGDDLWLPGKLARQVDVAARHPASGMIVCDGLSFGGPDVVAKPLIVGALRPALDGAPDGELEGHFHRTFIAGNAVTCPAQVLLPRAVVERVGPFIDHPAQDYDYSLRVTAAYPVTIHRDQLVRYRVHHTSLSGDPEHRWRAYARWSLEVLRGHLLHCTGEDRAMVKRRIGELSSEVAYTAYNDGRTGNRQAATHELLRQLGQRPWPPTALPYLLGLWTPGFLRGPAVRIRRGLRRLYRTR